MKKDKKFLNELENNLVGIKDKFKIEILNKYENLIKEEKDNGKKITVILKEIGKPEDVALKEIEALGSKGNKNFFDRLKDKYNERKDNKEKKEKEKEENAASKKLKDKNIKVSVKGGMSDKEKEKKLKQEKKEKEAKLKEKKKLEEKEKKEKEAKLKEKNKLKEEKRKEKEQRKEAKRLEREKRKEEKARLKAEKYKDSDKEKSSFKEKLHKVKVFFTKDISFKKQREVTDEPKEIVEEIKEEVEEEVAQVSEIVSEKELFESEPKRKRRIFVKIIGVLLTIVVLFAWLWVCIVFVASIVAYLDGVKFKGLIIGLFGLSLLMLWIVIMVNRSIFRKKMSVTLNLIIIIVSIILIALGTVLTIKQISSIKTVKDVSIKYSMTTKMNSYEFPDNKEKKFTLTFNSNYNTQYTINYDKTLKDKFKLEVKYYECYYDYFIKQTSNSAYVSLKLDDRDRLSVYIDDLKEGLIFDNDELARYSVKITINPNDMERLVILN